MDVVRPNVDVGRPYVNARIQIIDGRVYGRGEGNDLYIDRYAGLFANTLRCVDLVGLHAVSLMCVGIIICRSSPSCQPPWIQTTTYAQAPQDAQLGACVAQRAGPSRDAQARGTYTYHIPHIRLHMPHPHPTTPPPDTFPQSPTPHPINRCTPCSHTRAPMPLPRSSSPALGMFFRSPPPSPRNSPSGCLCPWTSSSSAAARSSGGGPPTTSCTTPRTTFASRPA